MAYIFQGLADHPLADRPEFTRCIVESELHQRLEQVFPVTSKRKRNSIQFGTHTWKLFAERQRLRKVLSAHRLGHERLLLYNSLCAWRRDEVMKPVQRSVIQYILRMAFVCRHYKRLHGDLQYAIQDDRAQHLKTFCATLDNATKGDIMQKLRPFKIGKRRKDLGKKPMQIVKTQEGTLAKTPEEAMNTWRKHYADMEAGHEISKEALFWKTQCTPETVEFNIHEVPSLLELERQLRAAKPHKSMGMDAIPAELLRAAPRQMAYHLWPWFVKQPFTISECVQHKGGQLVSVFKRKGEISAPSNHRALLVSSCISKSFHNTFRRRTMPYVHSYSGELQISSQTRPSVLTAAHAVRAFLNKTKLQGRSSFALFVDISHAFYRVVRQLAYGADHSDEDTVQLLRRLGFSDFCLQDLAEQMQQPAALDSIGCPEFLKKQVRELHTNTWFNLSQDSAIVLTLVERLEQRLHQSEAFGMQSWNGEYGVKAEQGHLQIPTSLVVWADDVCILGEDDCAENIVHKLRFTCNTMVEELISFGLQPNFKEGKTEAIIDPRGKGSAAVRRRIFTENKCRLELQTNLPEQPDLKIVARYKHLGGIISHGAKMKPEVQHRVGQGHSTFRDYHSKVYRNPKISLETRLMVLNATTMAAMQYGAGTWTCMTLRDMQIWNTAHMSLYRKLFYKIYSFEDVRHMTDSYILTTLQVPHPSVTLKILRLRWYGTCLLFEKPAFWAILAQEGRWLQDVAKDLQWLYEQIKGYTWLPDPMQDPDARHLLARMHPSRWKKLLKRATLHCVWQHKVQHTVAEYHQRALQLLGSFGAKMPELNRKHVEKAHYCFICDRSFDTFAGWAVHSFKAHGRVNKWRRLQAGHTCLSCAKTFHSAARLSRHFRSVKVCADTLASRGLWVPLEPSFGSTIVTQQEKELVLATWDYTDEATIPVQQGWATTEQTLQFYRYCLSLDWKQAGATELCLEFLRSTAVCDTELQEVQEHLSMDITEEEDMTQITETFNALRILARPETTMVEQGLTLVQCVEELAGCDPPTWPSPQPLRAKFRYILHLFSGVRRKGDLHSIIQDLPTPDGYVFYPASIDVVLCADKGDLTSIKAQRFWLDASASGAIFGAIGGPPCETWSVSRWRFVIEQIGPRPIRNGMDLLETIWAAFPVRIRDLRQLDCANQLLLFMVLLLISQAATSRTCILEHPACPDVRPDGVQPASIWILPIITYLRRCPNIHLLNVKQGYWGARSPKPTSLLVACPSTTTSTLYDLMDAHRTQDKLPAPLAMGRSSHGSYNTAPLKRYTMAFCHGLASIMEYAARIVPYSNIPEDDLCPTFASLREAYLKSSLMDDDGRDGNDYAVKGFQKTSGKNN